MNDKGFLYKGTVSYTKKAAGVGAGLFLSVSATISLDQGLPPVNPTVDFLSMVAIVSEPDTTSVLNSTKVLRVNDRVKEV